MKTVVALPVFWLIACGQANQNESRLIQSSPIAVSARQSEGDELLGIAAVKADLQGGFASMVNVKTKNPPLNAELAFGNMVKFTEPGTQNKCSGAFAFEPDPASPATMAIVYFYTATHCFEKINPLGFTSISLSQRVADGLPIPGATKFLKPYVNTSRAAAAVTKSNPEVLHDGPQRTDIVRFKQFGTSLAQAKLSFLPTCANASALPLGRELAIGVLADDAAGIVQANSKVGLKFNSSGPENSQPLRIANSGIGKTFLLDRVGSVPGESGGPIWLIDGDKNIDKMNAYLCLQGVLSREVIAPEIISTRGGYELKISSYYTPATKLSDTVRWVKVQ